MRRKLTRGYRRREEALTRVRGRIDVLVTRARRLLDRGEVACRFDELTLEPTRNRFVRAALERIARIVANPDLAYSCASLAGDLRLAGVSGLAPSRADLAKEHFGRNDVEDRWMIAVARLAFDLALPTEEAGGTPLTSPDRDEHWVRRLFERAVAGFYSVELKGWHVRHGHVLDWERSEASARIESVLPTMKTDVLLDSPEGRRIVIETKFTGIVVQGWYREVSLRSGFLYQLYAYLRSQERLEAPASPWTRASGILLHPAVDTAFDENVTIQGHRFRFVTVDLAASTSEIRDSLRRIVATMP